MKKYALIKDNLVDNIIVSDDVFIDTIEQKYDMVLDINTVDIPPSIGDSYSPELDLFYGVSRPIIGKPVPPLDNISIVDQLESLVLEEPTVNFNVSLNNGLLTVGCRTYFAKWFACVNRELLAGRSVDSGPITRTEYGVLEGGFQMSKENMERILDLLIDNT